MKKLIALFVVLLSVCAVSTPAMAGSVSVYANPHNDGKRGNGVGVSVAVQATEKVDLSINYLDTDTNGGGNQTWDARVGVSAPIVSKLSAIAEVGYGAPYRARTFILPVAFGLKYPIAGNVAAVVKGTRYFKDSAKQDVQWTAGLTFGF
ncbi:MAG: hypothetical protein WAV98_04230 [Minisyncoccia bacterium]